jgi:GNAT superfamily N-acetyltransferase
MAREANQSQMNISIELVHARDDALAGALAALALDAVAHGASVGWLADLTTDDAAHWARGVLADVGGDIALWVARVDGRIVGTVQYERCAKPNGRHRAEVRKLLVHSAWRRHGVGARLMRALEATAHDAGIELLHLDTSAGSSAEALYASLGWTRSGEIPHFAAMSDGEIKPTAIWWKRLRG